MPDRMRTAVAHGRDPRAVLGLAWAAAGLVAIAFLYACGGSGLASTDNCQRADRPPQTFVAVVIDRSASDAVDWSAATPARLAQALESGGGSLRILDAANPRQQARLELREPPLPVDTSALGGIQRRTCEQVYETELEQWRTVNSEAIQAFSRQAEPIIRGSGPRAAVIWPTVEQAGFVLNQPEAAQSNRRFLLVLTTRQLEEDYCLRNDGTPNVPVGATYQDGPTTYVCLPGGWRDIALVPEGTRITPTAVPASERQRLRGLYGLSEARVLATKFLPGPWALDGFADVSHDSISGSIEALVTATRPPR